MPQQDLVKQQFKYYTFLAILYAVFAVTAQALAYRLIEVFSFLEPGGIFVFPVTFIINDIITEVYGPTLARRSIFFGLWAQGFFSIYALVIIHFPYPDWWKLADNFNVVFGASWLVFLSNLVALVIGMLYNTQLMARSKWLTAGRLFALRSMVSSAIGELILTAVIVAIALAPVEGKKVGISLFTNMFLFKLVFSFIMVLPASFAVTVLKRIDKVDAYEKVSFNPFHSLKQFTKKPLYDEKIREFKSYADRQKY